MHDDRRGCPGPSAQAPMTATSSRTRWALLVAALATSSVAYAQTDTTPPAPPPTPETPAGPPAAPPVAPLLVAPSGTAAATPAALAPDAAPPPPPIASAGLHAGARMAESRSRRPSRGLSARLLPRRRLLHPQSGRLLPRLHHGARALGLDQSVRSRHVERPAREQHQQRLLPPSRAPRARRRVLPDVAMAGRRRVLVRDLDRQRRGDPGHADVHRHPHGQRRAPLRQPRRTPSTTRR